MANWYYWTEEFRGKISLRDVIFTEEINEVNHNGETLILKIRSIKGLMNPLKEGEELLDNLLSQQLNPHWIDYEKLSLVPCSILPGNFYRRTFRPVYTGFLNRGYRFEPEPFRPETIPPNDPTLFQIGVNQLSLLIDRLEHIFRTVHPDAGNLAVYGPEIRNVIILAATEVEAQMQGILKANNYKRTSNKKTKKKEKPSELRLGTGDFVKLKKPLKLDQYKLRFAEYPWLKGKKPFDGWIPKPSTQSLPWYDVYNKIKHDRETNYGEATLDHAISAVMACMVLMVAQYGILPGVEKVASFFQFDETPKWDYTEYYLYDSPPSRFHPPYDYNKWEPIDFPF